jgi:hypothetical protein
MTAHVRSASLVQRLFDWKVRGIRWVEIIGVVCVAAMIFSVYIAKTAAARESTEIGKLEADISETRQRVRLLRAQISRLEQPSRLQELSLEAGLGPVDVHRQATEGQLTDLKPVTPAPAVPAPVAQPAAPTPPPVADEAPQ